VSDTPASLRSSGDASILKDLKRPSAFLFDFSGTLVNDLEITIEAINQVIREIGATTVKLRSNEFKRKFRSPYWQFLDQFGVSRTAAETVAPKIFQNAYLGLIRRARMFPDVAECLLKFKAAKTRTGIVSSTPKSVIARVLEINRMQHFDIIVGLEDCEDLKPSPLPIVRASERLGRDCEEVAYVGDMVEDVVSAQRAGAMPIVVWRGDNSYQSLSELKRSRPAMLVTTLAQISCRFGV